MMSNRPARTVFREGDEVVLGEGTYQGTLGVFVRLRDDVAWADIGERNGTVRSHPVRNYCDGRTTFGDCQNRRAVARCAAGEPCHRFARARLPVLFSRGERRRTPKSRIQSRRAVQSKKRAVLRPPADRHPSAAAALGARLTP